MSIKSGQDGISLELRDDSGVISHQLHDQPFPRFWSRYSLRTVKALLKVSPEETTWMVGTKGVIQTKIKGLDVYILPMA